MKFSTATTLFLTICLAFDGSTTNAQDPCTSVMYGSDQRGCGANTQCIAGGCNQEGLESPSCGAALCNQKGASNPTCGGGVCDQSSSSNPTCDGQMCCQEGATGSPSCGVGAVVGFCDPAIACGLLNPVKAAANGIDIDEAIKSAADEDSEDEATESSVGTLAVTTTTAAAILGAAAVTVFGTI